MSSAAAQLGRYSKLSWSTAFFMTLFHIGAVWALFQFTWAGLAVFFITYYISLSLGIGMAYHRLLTHRSYKTPKSVELASLNSDHPHRTIPVGEIEWIARIIWASQ